MLTAPSENEVEVSVFGPGYGESILIHVPPRDWIVVDSCVNQKTKRPAALEYLERIGVNVATDVKLVAASHWHDDHIRGLGEIVLNSQNADFIMSSALKNEHFINLVNALGKNPLIEGTSGLKEFDTIIATLLNRKKVPILASENKVLWTRREKGKPICQIFSLSPSDLTFFQVVQAFENLFPEPKKPKKRVLPKLPNINHISVTLWVQIDNFIILLGADLEESTSPKAGWNGIVKSTNRPQGRAFIFKIPHHGSETAENSDVWEEMLINNPLSLCTPYNRGTTLPKTSDVQRICSRTNQAYITSSKKIKSADLKSRFRPVDKLLKNSGIKFIERPLETGHVRTRFILADIPISFPVELFNGACCLDSFDL